MRLIRCSVRLLGLGAAAAAALGGVADATSLVVRASGPSATTYPPGKMLPDTAHLVLKANDEVVLLDNKGTRTLRGPGNFSALATASVAASNGTALAALVDQRSDRRVRIGAVRTVDGTDQRPPNIWYIDSSRGGTVCIADPAQAMIWRPNPDKPASVSVAPTAGTPATIDWGAAQAIQPWPQTLPLTEGAQYRIAGAPAAIKISLVGTPPEQLQDMAQVLIKHGCTAQLDLLVTTTNAADAAGQ
ncbi:hypothetical protein [Sphingomonas sp. MMS24-J13]|uniref:hypothetical protein n=1 Tax=Sphingomonas sp. MMS24-J13 TaxID=3238686 RepID=UPI00384B39D7